ncbi:MAG: replication-associated recombination protein A [Thermotogota bacterium]
MKSSNPLSEILRPKKIEEIIGNEKLKNIFRKWIDNKSIRSFVVYGPPGSGKSTFIKAIINEIESDYEIYQISGALEGAKTLKSIVNKEDNLFSKQKILFVDEIHRLNRAEQDTLLLNVENGDVILFGATTENPAVRLNPALLSRVNLFKIKEFDEEEYKIVFERIENFYKGIKITEKAKKEIINYSNGDLRRIINFVEAIVESGTKNIDLNEVDDFTGKTMHYDVDDKYSYISAFIKSVRGSDPDAALLYLSYMLENGEDPMYLARRIVILAGEDIGLADPNALNIAVSAMTATEQIGYPECFIPLSEATVYLAAAPKSNSSYKAYLKAKEFIKNNNFRIPFHLMNAINKNMKKQGYGNNYKYPHDFGGYIKEKYMPENYKDVTFYNPKNNGLEKKIGERIKKIWSWLKKY